MCPNDVCPDRCAIGAARFDRVAWSIVRFQRPHNCRDRRVLTAEDRSLPECVRENFEAFLRCGVLDHGFLRVVCEQCHAVKFVWNEFEQP